MRHKDSNKKQEYQVAARYSLVRIHKSRNFQKTSHLLQGFLCLPHLRQRGQPVNALRAILESKALGGAIIAYCAKIVNYAEIASLTTLQQSNPQEAYPTAMQAIR